MRSEEADHCWGGGCLRGSLLKGAEQVGGAGDIAKGELLGGE